MMHPHKEHPTERSGSWMNVVIRLMTFMPVTAMSAAEMIAKMDIVSTTDRKSVV